MPHCGAKRGAKNNKGKTGLKDQKTFISQIGWKSARGNLRETFDVMKHIYSIDDMEKGIMKQIFD